MLYLREDDMDEMLRKAAENYDVDASRAANWDAVNAAVHNVPGAAEKKKKRRFVFWWLLLVPAGWFANVEYNKFHASADQISNRKTVKAEAQNKTTEQLSSSPVIPHNNYPD